jgi:hypothetical protein
MDKRTAITLLGGTPTKAARAVGVTPQAVNGWPEQLSARIEDRVWAAKARLDAATNVPNDAPAS